MGKTPEPDNSGLAASVPATAKAPLPLLDYQQADVESNARFNWCCWSRQIGKSFTKSLRRLLRGLERRRTQLLLSAGERQSAELMLKVRQHCQALDIACRAFGDRLLEGTRFRELTIELPNGVRVIGLPANPQTIRGFTGDVLLDEFAMHADDKEIWAAVFPSILRDGGELDVASTPKGSANVFAQLRLNDRFRHSTVTLVEAVAAGLRVDPEEIRAAMQDELLYRQEFCCEFLDDRDAFLTQEQIAGVQDPSLTADFDPRLLAACAGPLFCGVDIGRLRDLTVFWVLEAEGDMLVTRAVRQTQGEPFREQWEALRELLSLRRVRRCCIDAGGMGMPLAEAAVEAFGSSRVEAVTFTPAIRMELAARLRLRVEARAIRIPADECIRADFSSVRRGSGGAVGHIEVARGPHGHADRFWAACLAVRAAGSDAGAVEWVRGEGLRFSRAGIW